MAVGQTRRPAQAHAQPAAGRLVHQCRVHSYILTRSRIRIQASLCMRTAKSAHAAAATNERQHAACHARLLQARRRSGDDRDHEINKVVELLRRHCMIAAESSMRHGGRQGPGTRHERRASYAYSPRSDDDAPHQNGIRLNFCSNGPAASSAAVDN
jgi:hypothetical protein